MTVDQGQVERLLNQAAYHTDPDTIDSADADFVAGLLAASSDPQWEATNEEAARLERIMNAV